MPGRASEWDDDEPGLPSDGRRRPTGAVAC